MQWLSIRIRALGLKGGVMLLAMILAGGFGGCKVAQAFKGAAAPEQAAAWAEQRDNALKLVGEARAAMRDAKEAFSKWSSARDAGDASAVDLLTIANEKAAIFQKKFTESEAAQGLTAQLRVSWDNARLSAEKEGGDWQAWLGAIAGTLASAGLGVVLGGRAAPLIDAFSTLVKGGERLKRNGNGEAFLAAMRHVRPKGDKELAEFRALIDKEIRKLPVKS